MSKYTKCIEEIRKLYNAYEEAITVSIGMDKYQHPQIIFTIVAKKNKGDNK